MKTNRLLITFVLLGELLLASCAPRAKVGALRNESQSVELGDDKSINVEIDLGAGNLELTGGAEKLLEADFTYNVAALKPEVRYRDGELVVRQPEVKGLPDLRGITDFRNEWGLHLSDEVPMDLKVDVGGGSSDLQLAGLSLTGLDVSLGAGDYTVDLSGNWVRDLDVTIDAGAADLTVRLPSEVGARVEISEGPHLVQVTGLLKDGNAYTNAAYGLSKTTLRIALEAGIGMINLEIVENTQAKASLQNLLDQQVKEQDILGMVMAERLADGTVIWDTTGYTSPSGKERWSADTASPIASVTKTFTAVVVMQKAMSYHRAWLPYSP